MTDVPDTHASRPTPAQTAAARVTDRLTEVARAPLAAVDELASNLRQAAERSLKAHREMPPSLYAKDPVRPLEPMGQLYAHATADRVLGPLVGALRAADAGRQLVEGWEGVQAALRRGAEDLDAGAYEGDSDAYTAIVGYHATERLPEGLVPLYGEAVDGIGLWAHLLEQGAKGWWRALVGIGEDDEEIAHVGVQERIARAEAILEEALDQVAGAEWAPLAEAVGSVLAACRDDLSADFESALSGRKVRRAPREEPLTWRQVSDGSSRWADWHREAAARLALVVTLVRVRDGLYGLAKKEIDRVRTRAEAISGDAEEQVAALRELADELHKRSQNQGIPPAQELDRLMHEVLDPLKQQVSDAVDQFTDEAGPAESGERMAEAAYRFVASQPERFVVHRIADGASPDPSSSPITFEFRRVVSQCVDTWLIERLRSSGEQVVEAAAHARAEAAELSQIILAAFDALVEEMDEADGDSVAREELVRTIPEALRRAADVTERVRELLLHDLDDWEAEARETIDVGWERLTARAIVSSGVGEQLAGLKSEASIRLRQAVTDAVDAARGAFRRGRAQLGRAGRVGRRLQRWLEPAAPGEAEIDRGAPARELLARVDWMGDEIPLVYRRLMTFEPVPEASLLIGREGALERIEASVSGADRRPLLILKDPGAGFRSLVRVARERIPDGDERILELDLEERILDHGGLLTAFSEAGIPDQGFGLRQIGAQIVDHFPDVDRPIVLVRGLEHAFQRSNTGLEVLKAFTSTMVESSGEVCWIASMASPAWQVASKASPHLSAGLEILALGPLGRGDLEEAVWKRHVRSGIPLEFRVPEDASPIFTRRLNRAHDEQEREEILKEEYFDRLHRQSGGWVGTAIALWLNGLTIDASARRAEIRPPIHFSESFLDGLDQEEVFCLKAFLEHGTLAVQEIRDVLRVTHGDAGRILERLLDAELVTPVAPAGSGFTGPWVQRFRIRTIAVPLVWRFLQRRNVLHL